MNTAGWNKGGSWPKATGAAALALALVLAPAQLAAQSVSDYRLPGAETPRPNVQGPVDPDNPEVRGPAPRPSVTPPPAPVATTPLPSPQPGVSPAASPQPRAVQPRPAPSAARPAPTSAIPATPSVGPVAVPALPSVLPTPGAAPSPFPAALPDVSPATTGFVSDAPGGWPWPWIAGGGALLLAALVALLWRRRHRTTLDLEVDFEPPVVAPPKPAPEPKPELQPALLAVAAIPTSGIGIALEVRRMNASLMATTLSYNVKLTNHSAEPLSALAIEGDMVAAHASLPPELQIASSAQRLELRHALVALAPGESAEFTGDFRLPLTAIIPIRSGNAAFFVPLARLRVEASTPSGSPLIEAQTFVIGELSEAPGAALRPFRLDLGPRNYMQISQRAVG